MILAQIQPGLTIECELYRTRGVVKYVAADGLVVWVDERKQRQKTPASLLSYVPSPEDIAAAAAEIRATWSEGELKSRLRLKNPEVDLRPIPNGNKFRRMFGEACDI